MATVNVEFYKNFSKRQNSTKQPLESSAKDSFSCYIKDNCRVTEPVIEIVLTGSTPLSPVNPAKLGYNYAYISDFSRYYFVNDWNYYKGTWTASLSVDVLASFKTQIGALSKYVRRSASTFDGDLIDTYYPTKLGADITYSFVDNPFLINPFGSFIVGIVGRNVLNVPNIGGVNYYLFTYDEMREFIGYLLSDPFADLVSDPTAGLTQSVAKAMVNPTDYIESCIWFPFTIEGISATVQPQLGWWSMSPLSNGCSPLGSGFVNSLKFYYKSSSSGTTIYDNVLQLPSHPQISRGNYLDYEPYSTYIFHLEPWGDIPLRASDIMGYNSITFEIFAEGLTGMGAIEIYNGADKLIERRFAQLGVTMSISQIISEFSTGGVTAGAIGGLAIANQKNDLIGIAKDLFTFNTGKRAQAMKEWGAIKESVWKDVMSGIEAYNSNATVQGVNGSIISLTGSQLATGMDSTGAYLKMIRFNLVDENLDETGRPLNKMKTINTLSGYIECADGDCDIPCYDYEKASIGVFLTGGFFYE